jgi:predicted ribosomally synthesized peptide with nif11-like leader
MSHQSFVDFMKTLQQDGEMQKELHARLGDPEGGVAIKDLSQFAAGKGYQFDVSEVQSELSDQQLDAAAGGLFDVFQKGDGLVLLQKDWGWGGFGGKIFPKVR